jgi:acetoin utilization protein AcuB
MLVRKWMSPDPLTIQAAGSISEAVHLMKDHHIRHLPVLEGDRLVGIVSDRDLKEFTPSKATALDVYEVHYLLAKAKITAAVHPNPLRVSPEDSIEKAARLMHESRIGCLPVVDAAGKVVGILAHDDVFAALVQVTGCGTDTVRFQMTIADEPGSIKVVADKVRTHDLKIRSILTTYQDVPAGQRELVIRVGGDTLALERELKEEYPDLMVHRGC